MMKDTEDKDTEIDGEVDGSSLDDVERASLTSLGENEAPFKNAQLVIDIKTEDNNITDTNTNNYENQVESFQLGPMLENDRLSPEENFAENPEDDDDNDSSSTISVFAGSLRMDIIDTPWETDIERKVDIQLGEDEWGTRLNKVEGGLRMEAWQSRIADISKQSEDNVDEWNTAIRNFSEELNLHENWTSTIAEQLQNLQLHVGWATTFNAMENIENVGNKWTSKLQKIGSRGKRNDKWTSKFNKISTKNAEKQDWQFKLTRNMKNEDASSDWSSRFNAIEDSRSVGQEGSWDSSFADILLRCGDRDTHWESKFRNIGQHNEQLDTWPTSFNEISPPDENENEQWATKFLAISEESDLPEHWNSKFLQIGETREGENPWEIKVHDVPDNWRVPADWSTSFNGIEDSEKNVLWDTLFNEIGDTSDELTAWECKFLPTDLEDMGREAWQTNYNAILPNENKDLEWEIHIKDVSKEGGGEWIDKGDDEEISTYLNKRDETNANVMKRTQYAP